MNASVSGSDRAKRAVRFATWLFLLAVVGSVLLSAFPAIGRALGDAPVPTAKRGIARFARGKGYAVGTPRVPDRAAMSPLDRSRGLGRHARAADNSRAGVPSALQFAVAISPLWLRGAANEESASVALAPVGKPLAIMKDEGAWLFVALNEDDGMKFGWVRRARLRFMDP